jgi:hypothetical protein
MTMQSWYSDTDEETTVTTYEYDKDGRVVKETRTVTVKKKSTPQIPNPYGPPYRPYCVGDTIVQY